jgi:Protein of unknown function (DUF3606)
VDQSSVEFSQASEPLQAQPIDINRESAVSYWLDKLGCSEFELRVAVAEVGPFAGDVGNRLGIAL